MTGYFAELEPMAAPVGPEGIGAGAEGAAGIADADSEGVGGVPDAALDGSATHGFSAARTSPMCVSREGVLEYESWLQPASAPIEQTARAKTVNLEPPMGRLVQPRRPRSEGVSTPKGR